MRLPAIIITILLLTTGQAFAQFDYDLYEKLSSEKERQYNSRLVNSTMLMQNERDRWDTIFFSAYESRGFPTMLIYYDDKGKQEEKKEFQYNDLGYISKIETFKNGKHDHSTEFETDNSGKVVSSNDYVYSSADGEKMFFSQTVLQYNGNGTMSRMIKLQWKDKDTIQIDDYDTAGVKKRSLSRIEGPGTTITEYRWNKDKTQMKEVQYKMGATDSTIITHTYKEGKEVERITPSAPTPRLYWKYNNVGRLIETNEPLLFIESYTYDDRGYMKTKTLRNPYPEPNVKEQANKEEFKYEYQFREKVNQLLRPQNLKGMHPVVIQKSGNTP